MTKLNQIFKRKKGSIILFVLFSIAALGAVLIPLLEKTSYENAFYEVAARSCGFFDKQNQLRGLVETESESMCNLLHAEIYDYYITGAKLFERPISTEENTSKKFYDGKFYDIKSILEELNFTSDISHNTGLVCEVALLPADNRLPFTKKFANEISDVLGNSLSKELKITSNKRNNSKINAFISDIPNILNEKNELLSTVQGPEDFRMLESWQKLVGLTAVKGQSPVNAPETDIEKSIKEAINKNIVFSKDVEAVNFFAANSVVQQAITKEFYKLITKDDKENIKNKLGEKAAIKFTFRDDGKLNFTGNTIEVKVNKALIDLMFSKGFAVDIDSDKYENLSKEGKLETWKVIMKRVNDGFSSYSGAFEVKTYVYDEDFKSTNNFKETYFCHSYK